VPGLSADDRAAIEQAADAYVAAMRQADWERVAGAFSEEAVRIPPNEEPHQGRQAIESWLRGIEELNSYELVRDQIDGADGMAYVRGRYAITLRPVGAPVPISDEGDFLEVWQRGRDGTWSIAEAMWNTRLPFSA
jgi:ketosteroid isomerase-like protein